NTPVSLAFIQEKAMNLNKCIAIEGETGQPGPFNASHGWFHRFHKRYDFNNTRVQGEAASADKNAAEAFPEMLKTIIEERGSDPQQVFSADEMGLYWKHMWSRTYISVNENKALKDCLCLLLGGNASGDMKLVYCSENPHAMKNDLPVIWNFHRKAWMTRQLFREWLVNYLVPEMKKYCEENNLMFKIFLILDNAITHDLDFKSLCSNIKVVFMPPRITSFMQLMDRNFWQTSK
uniref:HTH CENPB-type domain-containing protein n=1 Tax=Pelodiscus sinensis TaxID=13735 RepID=K7FAB2_PELSI